MSRKKLITTLTGFTLALTAVVVFRFSYIPWARTWGANEAEVRAALPGDDVVRQPTFDATRAVSIQAPPDRVWPWLVQMGYRRAGFYSYDRLDNAGIPSAERILPQYQSLKPGDAVPLGKNNATVTVLVTNQRLVLQFPGHSGGAWSWAWTLEREKGGGTRLITRLRTDERALLARFMLDAVEIVMMRKCLLGIKRRAEAAASTLTARSAP